ncbi:hypothetical protein [Methylobacterium tarhaniae]|uniref:hypothetical protein n=1 Tax=Methylobacterium tarhaniae TaxID=1187852 RepID=UPI003D08F6AD
MRVQEPSSGKMIWVTSALSTLTSAIVAGMISYFSNYYSNVELDSVQRARSAKIDLIVKFSTGNEALLLEINKYIAAIAAGKDPKDVQDSLSNELIKQFNDSENIRLVFNSKEIVDDLSRYQGAIRDFRKSARQAKKPEDMPEWVAGFDKVYNARLELANELIKSVDVPIKQLPQKGS